MTQSPDPTCLFCKIVAREIPARVVLETDDVLVFRDINPQMRTHVLMIPKQHVANSQALGPEHDALVGRLIRTAKDVAKQEGVAGTGYRLVINTGEDALNTVPHLHVHMLGGQRMGWPPG